MKLVTPVHFEPRPSLQEVEVSSSFQIPAFSIIGLASQEIQEAKERVRAAVEASGFEFPRRRIVVNLSPASIKKHGTSADLAIALGILSHHSDSLRSSSHSIVAAVGELSLDGRVRPTGQMTRAVYSCLENKLDYLLVAKEDEIRARRAAGQIRSTGLASHRLKVIGVQTLQDAWKALTTDDGGISSEPETSVENAEPLPREWPAETHLPPSLARTLLISAVGAHHLLLLGPKGGGKSTAASLLAALLPDPSADELLSHSLNRELADPTYFSSTPFQSPCIRVSPPVFPSSLFGRTRRETFQPGALALAHGGLLIADELPEWPRDSREFLRDPLERKSYSISLGSRNVEIPTRFILAATGNLCPCGNYSPTQDVSSCSCTATLRDRYLTRLSGAILDRIDLVSLVDSVGQTTAKDTWVNLQVLRENAQSLRIKGKLRYGKPPGLLSSSELEAVLAPQTENHPNLTQEFSLRGQHKTQRVALTLALLAGRSLPNKVDLFEASLFRPERWMPRNRKS